MPADSNEFVNPISAGFRVLEEYRQILQRALGQQGNQLNDEDLSRITGAMEVDRGLIFSKTTSPTAGQSVEKVIQEVGYHPALIEVLDEAFGENPFFQHQEEAIRAISGESGDSRHTVVATGTGSGKTESFLVPAFNECLQHPSEGTKALLLYPMNALANDQLRRISSWSTMCRDQGHNITYGAYVGSTPKTAHEADRGEVKPLGDGHMVSREAMVKDPPDILLTNHVMLDYMLTRNREAELFERSADSLAFLVVDEIHTYSGTNATHLMHLLRRLHSRLDRDPVKVATSATLVSEGEERQGGQMRAKDSEKALSEYIKPLLGIDDFRHFTLGPREESERMSNETESESDNLAEYRSRLEDVEELDWLLGRDPEANARRLELVTGETIAPHMIAAIGSKKIYSKLDEDPFVRVMREALERRARSFQDLVSLCRRTYELGPKQDVESMVRAYLSLIAYVNRYPPTGEDPLLDFRMHLFIRNVGGRLKMCLQCNQYHTGKQNRCPDCGNPLFTTYAQDVSKCLARISGDQISYKLRPRSDDANKPVYVLLSADDGSTESEERQAAGPEGQEQSSGTTVQSMTTGELNFFEDTATINLGNPGQYRLELLDDVLSAEDAFDETVRLFDPNRDFDYLCRLSRSLLEYDKGTNRRGRLLGFVDSREKVSRYGMGLRDEFASQYLAARLAEEQVDRQALPALAKLVEAWKPEEAPDDDESHETAVHREASLWFHRCVGRQPSASGEDYLTLSKDLELSEEERHLLKALFLDTRAIYREPKGCNATHPYYAFQRANLDGPPQNTSYITLRKHLACRRHGIYTEEGAQSDSKNYTGLALTEQGRRLQSVRREYEDRTGQNLEHLQSLIEEWVSSPDPTSALQNDSILIKHRVPGSHDHAHYYLNPRCVQLDPAKLLEAVSIGEPDSSKIQGLRTAESHSSEKSAKEREAIEKAFDSDGGSEGQRLDVLMATPTLEMGVDIGELRTALMVGVPPMPSNYAQRAGRAGRNPNDGQALITTLCFGSKEHDNFYFNDPSKMVNGWVNAPRLNPDSVPVARKHLNAWMLEGAVASIDKLRRYAGNVQTRVSERLSDAKHLFGCLEGFDVEAYLDGPFQKLLKGHIEEFEEAEQRRSPQQYLYKSGFFPDYNFRQDEVPLVEAGTVENPEPVEDPEENQISSRAPERAYYKYAPSSTVYAGGRVYEVGSTAPYENVEVDGIRARNYDYFPGYVSERNTSPYADRVIFDRVEVFNVDGESTDSWDLPIDFEYYPSLALGFRNDGKRAPGGTESFFDEEGKLFSVGYTLERRAIRISIDGSVCTDRSVDVSLAFALDRAIKDTFRVGEGEIGMLVHPEPYHTGGENNDRTAAHHSGNQEQSPPQYRHIILYDDNGNENVPFDRVATRLKSEEWFRSIYQRIESCDCDGGCYECMRSHSTQYHAEALQKEKGLMALKYLAGDGPFAPTPSLHEDGGLKPDLVLTLKLSGDVFTVTSSQSDATVRKQYGEDFSYNEAMFDAVTAAALNEWEPKMKTLRVESNVPTLVNAINEHEVKNGREAFARLQFALLRWQNVNAEKMG